jgi:hypothetical protein
MPPDNSPIQRSFVLLSLQRAMLGLVFPALRGVSVEWDHRTIHVTAYTSGPLAKEDEESVSEMETEVMADFPESILVTSEIVRRDDAEPLPNVENAVWVYRRRDA